MGRNSKIKKHLYFLLLLIALGTGTAHAQQDKMYSQYMFNMMALNPAYAGSREVLSATGLYRNQWVNVEGAPKTMTFTIDMPVRNEKVGLGLQLYNDQIGIYKETGAFASYAFRIRVGENSTLALGLQGGAVSFQANYTDVRTNPDGGGVDPAFANNLSRILPNFGTGIYWSSSKAYLGISVPQLIAHNLSSYSTSTQRAKQRRHANLVAGVVLGLNEDLKLKPSLLAKYSEGTPLALDGNLTLWLYDRIAVGASYRHNQWSTLSNSKGTNNHVSDAIVGMVELQLNDQIRIGYAFDMMLNGLKQSTLGINSGTHELMLRYEFGFNKGKILTPRYF